MLYNVFTFGHSSYITISLDQNIYPEAYGYVDSHTDIVNNMVKLQRKLTNFLFILGQ